MKLIYATGFSKNEKLEWKPVVFNNIIQSMRQIFDAMADYGLEFENRDNEVSAYHGRLLHSSLGVVQVFSPIAWPSDVAATQRISLTFGFAEKPISHPRRQRDLTERAIASRLPRTHQKPVG